MQQFLNWRWYRGLGGGPIVDLGSHQIDIFNWYLNARPSGVTASGGTDYFNKATHQWYDTVMAIYDYQTPLGAARAFYQTITTNGFGGYFEVFMGDQGALEISESAGRGSIYRDTANAPDWKSYVKDGLLVAPKEEPKPAAAAAVLDRARNGAAAELWYSRRDAQEVSPTAPGEFFRGGARQEQAQLPGRNRV
ncbi:MAG: Gfo/Idh/MocA family oxidoreductase [Ignavibacteriota bacterium]